MQAQRSEPYPHFNPAKYDVQVKISSVRSGKHVKHNINYHVVWIPKYRRKLLKGRVAEILETIMTDKESGGLKSLITEKDEVTGRLKAKIKQGRGEDRPRV